MKIKHKLLLTTVSVLVLSMLVVSGCVGGVSSRGWAGGIVSDGILFAASMNGKIIAIDAGSGEILGSPVQLVVQSSGGLSCLPSSCGGGATTSAVVIYSSPVVQNNIVYIGGSDGKLHGYPFIDNTLRTNPEWLYPKSGSLSGAIIGNIVVVNDSIYFATANGNVYALNAEDLSEKWAQPYEIGSKVWSAPAVEGDTLYVGSLNRKLYAIDAIAGTLKWEYEFDGAINSAPLVYNGKVYIGDFSRHFYALDANSGQLVWEFPSADKSADNPQNWFWAKPVVLNGVIYAPCLDGNVYALNADNGSLVHRYVLGDSISSSPVVIGDTIAVATTDLYKKTGKVYIIDTLNKTQKELESFAEGINAPLFAYNGVVYVHTTKDNLYGLNPETHTKQTFSLSTVK
ncbi:MAG: PQQ-binding-like beta-propeller repeat protein [Dehalococcoidales bacterium]|nr:PQQ-binding-like beta-propeller repeat protein [Dehalococcoidales bacterium]